MAKKKLTPEQKERLDALKAEKTDLKLKMQMGDLNFEQTKWAEQRLVDIGLEIAAIKGSKMYPFSAALASFARMSPEARRFSGVREMPKTPKAIYAQTEDSKTFGGE